MHGGTTRGWTRPGWMAATNRQPIPRTQAEKAQRKPLIMKAVWRSHTEGSEAGLLWALAANRIDAARHLPTQDALLSGSQPKVAKGLSIRARTGRKSVRRHTGPIRRAKRSPVGTGSRSAAPRRDFVCRLSRRRASRASSRARGTADGTVTYDLRHGTRRPEPPS